MNFDDIRKLVLSVDDEKITEQVVEQLIKYLPNREEMMQLTTFKDKINDLSDAEKFGVIVSAVFALALVLAIALALDS